MANSLREQNRKTKIYNNLHIAQYKYNRWWDFSLSDHHFKIQFQIYAFCDFFFHFIFAGIIAAILRDILWYFRTNKFRCETKGKYSHTMMDTNITNVFLLCCCCFVFFAQMICISLSFVDSYVGKIFYA